MRFEDPHLCRHSTNRRQHTGPLENALSLLSYLTRKIMQYFTIEELVHSETALCMGLNNTPSPVIRNRLRILTETLLDPLRAEWEARCKVESWGNPAIIVTSGYRSAELIGASAGLGRRPETAERTSPRFQKLLPFVPRHTRFRPIDFRIGRCRRHSPLAAYRTLRPAEPTTQADAHDALRSLRAPFIKRFQNLVL